MRTPGETFKRFMACVAWARTGKTFMYVHPDFVAIDTKTWEKITKRERIPKRVYYDELDEWTPEKQDILDKWLKERTK